MQNDGRHPPAPSASTSPFCILHSSFCILNTMPTPALLLIIATLLPLASFVLLMFIGKRMGTPLAGYVATLAIGGSFVCSLVAMILWASSEDPAWGMEKGPINL